MLINHPIQGYVHHDFLALAQLFRTLLPTQHPGGAALCVYHRGEVVIDIWGGSRNLQGAAWEEDTLAMSYSTTKGILATLTHRMVDQGLLDYSDKVCRYWPEFACHGKEGITLRHLLCHEAGLYDIRSLIPDAREMLSWQTMVQRLETATTQHAPGATWGYHALTWGWLVGEMLQRCTGTDLASLLDTYLVKDLALDGCYIGLPTDQLGRATDLIPPPANRSHPRLWGRILATSRDQAMAAYMKLTGFDQASMLAGLRPHGIGQLDFNSQQVRQACIPAANGMFTARSLATVYAAMADRGRWQGKTWLHEPTWQQATLVQNRRHGQVIAIPMHWRLGYHRVFVLGRSPRDAFGHFGWGGSGAWADASLNLSLALTVNTGQGTPFGDSRLPRLNTLARRLARQR
ncbi:MAG: beta-lactamase family protein [Pseudomonadales bacterium]|nr:beta-lactamase family protein [Pseudomonadales bacterium]